MNAARQLATPQLGTDMLIIHLGRILGTACAVALLAVGWKRLRPADRVYGCVGLLLLLSSAWLISFPRYLIGLYPLFIVLGRIARRPVAFWAFLAVGVALQAALFWRYALGMWTF